MEGKAEEAVRGIVGIGADTQLHRVGMDFINKARSEAERRVRPMTS